MSSTPTRNWERSTGRPRSGSTILGLLLGLVLLSIVVGLALPRFRHARLESAAAASAADLEAIRMALISYQQSHGAWPDDATPGRIPAGLEALLPEGVDFERADHVVDYENWSGRSDGFIGLAVVTTGAPLRDAILAHLGEAGTWTDGPTGFTWVILWG